MNIENSTENNRVVIAGTVVSAAEFSHEVYDERFYTFMLEVPRLSEACDTVRVTISEKFIAALPIFVGMRVMIKGQFRSYNNFSNVGNKLILTVFVRDIEEIADGEGENANCIFLNGYICKPPVYRKTPFGREISDILLAVNRAYNKSDYIPCIAWGRNARYAETFNVGDNLIVRGRIQSREYRKKISETETETKTAFEVSVSKLELEKECFGEAFDDGDELY